jgi:hypothetical protein
MDTILKLVPEFYDADCMECGCGTYSGMRVEQTSVGALVAGLNDYELYQLGLVRVKPDADKKMNPTAINTLKQHGWVHAASAEDRAKRKELEQKFYLLNKQGSKYLFHYTSVNEMDLDDVRDDYLKLIAAGSAEIVQKVTPKSVLSEKDQKRLKTLETQKVASAKKAAEGRKAKAEAKKQKEIEKAKKILEEAGELNQKVEEKAKKYWAPKDSEIAAANAAHKIAEKYPNVDLGENG